ncbi:MAG: type II toxin-antitoxin system VapC family toxin [Actinomycetota bacterium]|nr:type II toxin-antitoxin system VapC family toxin [Actinomycetota bacterium]
MTVLDASALLAYLQGEDGSDVVEECLQSGGACGTANWAEVAQKVRGHGGDWRLARALLTSYGLCLEPVTVDDAEHAALSWVPGSGLSLADRLCLALGQRLDAAIVTADRSWGTSHSIRQIR